MIARAASLSSIRDYFPGHVYIARVNLRARISLRFNHRVIFNYALRITLPYVHALIAIHYPRLSTDASNSPLYMRGVSRGTPSD